MNPSIELQNKLKACDPDVSEYLKCLLADRKILLKRIGKLEFERGTDKEQIVKLKRQLKRQPIPTIVISKEDSKLG